ncbi:MAG: portal protein, partial [Planctomycetota bacterium]
RMNWLQKPLFDRILERWKEKDSDYGTVNANRESVCMYFRSDEIVETDDKGELVGQNIYNGSGSWYSRMMATGFQGSLVSKNIPWIRYMMEQFKLKGIEELDLWLQDVKLYMGEAYQKSNFYDVQPQFTHDGITTGSPVMFGEDDVIGRRTMWLPQHYKTVRVYYNKFNEPEGLIVKDTSWTAKQIFDTFIKTDDANGTRRRARLNIAVNQALDSGMLNSVFAVYKAVFKVTDPIWNGEGKDAFKKPAGRWKWLSVYFLELTDSERDKKDTPLNDNIGDFVQPFAMWNYDKKPWEVSSRTPAWYAIWDCLSLQQIDRNWSEDIQYKNRPPFVALDTMRNKVDLSPEGEMFVSDEEYDKPPKPIDRIAGLDFSKELMELKVEALKRWFYADRFQMFTDLIRMNKQPVTATQIWQMAGEKAALLSPAIETHSKYLETTDAFMMDVEIRAGRGPFNPQRLENIADIVSGVLGPLSKVGVRPVFIGQLAQSQKVTQALEPIQSTMGAVAPLFDIWPDLRIMFREYDTANDIAEAFDFPQKNLLPKEEYEKRLAAINEKRAQDEQLAKALEIAKASKDISGSVDPNSILGSAVGAKG